jgi:hypothetical protein
MRLWLVILAGCAGEISPLSLEVHYQADSPRLTVEDSLRVGVGRFSDARPRTPGDFHTASYVARDRSYHLGLSWNGRTFAAANLVTQALLVDELRHAGIDALPLDVEIAADDLPGAIAAGRNAHLDAVLGGTLHELSDTVENGAAMELEAALFDSTAEKALLHAPFGETRAVPAELTSQQRIDDLLQRSFRPLAHQLVAQVGRELVSLAVSRKAQLAVTPAPEPEPPPAVEPSPEPVVHHHKGRHR